MQGEPASINTCRDRQVEHGIPCGIWAIVVVDLGAMGRHAGASPRDGGNSINAHAGEECHLLEIAGRDRWPRSTSAQGSGMPWPTPPGIKMVDVGLGGGGGTFFESVPSTWKIGVTLLLKGKRLWLALSLKSELIID